MGSRVMKKWSSPVIWGLIKKDCFYFFGYLLIVIAATMLLLVEDGMDRSLVMMLGAMVFVASLGPQFMSELMESKFEGNRILSILPISSEEIVTARFVRSFLFVALFSVYGFVLLILFSPSRVFLKLGSLYFLVLIAVCLLIVSLLFIGLFRFGFSRIFKFLFAILPIVFILAPGLIKIAFRSKIAAIDTAPLLDWLSWPKLLLFAAFVSGICGLLFVAAIRVKRRDQDNG